MYNTAKFLDKILRPMVGLNDHHIINSDDFISKIGVLKYNPGQKLMSYDVFGIVY